MRALIVLVTTGLVSLFLATGFTRLAADALLPLDPRTSAAAPRDDRPRRDSSAIVDRNLFESQRVVLGGPPPRTPPDPSAPPPACDGAIRLVGAFYSRLRPERSFAAIVNAAGKSLLYRRGMRVDERAIDAIDATSVTMIVGAARCSLTMFTSPAGVAPIAAIGGLAAIEPLDVHPLAGRIPSTDLDAGITRISDTEYRIERGLANRILEHRAELPPVRAMLHEEHGRIIGVKVYGIRRNGVLSRLGVQNGDVLRTINGFDLTSLDSALEAYGRLRDADHLTLAVDRRGQPTNVNFDIR